LTGPCSVKKKKGFYYPLFLLVINSTRRELRRALCGMKKENNIDEDIGWKRENNKKCFLKKGKVSRILANKIPSPGFQ